MSRPLLPVVTRYGGVVHLARDHPVWVGGERHHTLCRGTSAWTLASWEKIPDHPLLSIEQIKALPPCGPCRDRAEAGPS